VSGACLVYALQGTNWDEVGAVLRGAHVGWCLAVIALSVSCHVLRAERWRVLLRPVDDVPRWPAIAGTFIGFGANAVLPLRLGELVRPAFLARRVGIPFSDTLLVVCCLFLVALVYQGVPDALRYGGILLGVLMIAGLAALVLAQRHRETAERWIARVLGLLPAKVAEPLASIAEGFLHGLDALADLRIVAVVLVYSIVLWGMITLTYTWSFFALDVPIPRLAGSLVTVVIVAASVFLPQGPGFVGTWQAGCLLALHTIFHVPRDLAVGFSLLTWVIQMTANVGSALVAIAIEGVSLRELRAEARAEVPET
jgi:glycosyltransferase 2 family protein